MIPSSFPNVNASKWEAIIFDLDDTLYPERDYVLSGFRAVGGWVEKTWHLPATGTFFELQGFFTQGVRGDIFNQWLHKHDLDPSLVQSLVRAYREHRPTLEPFPGTRKMLESLKRRYRLGLLSDGYLEVQKNKFAALGLESFFEVVVFSDQFGREHWKPSVRPFQTAAELFQLDPAQMIYVADNPAKDFLGARQLGIFTVRLHREGGEYSHVVPETEKHASDTTLTSFAELESFLGSPPAV